MTPLRLQRESLWIAEIFCCKIVFSLSFTINIMTDTCRELNRIIQSRQGFFYYFDSCLRNIALLFCCVTWLQIIQNDSKFLKQKLHWCTSSISKICKPYYPTHTNMSNIPLFLSGYSFELLCFRKKRFTPVIAFSSTEEQQKVTAIWPKNLATFAP